MARKFLYVVSALIVMAMAVMVALRFWPDEMSRLTFVPSAEFTPQPPVAVKAYADPAMWIARPGQGADDPARWLPPGLAAGKETGSAAVFFVHPTSYFSKSAWNAPLDDTSSRELAALFVKGMASPFNASGQIWAPRYRQATLGAFLTDKLEGHEATDLAYGDVVRAFDQFVAGVALNRPIVLVGHSQGAFLLRRLLRDRVAGTALADRIAAAYLIGWPISLRHDLPSMGLPACVSPAQTGCIVSWLSVAEPAETGMLTEAYARQKGLDGQDLRDSAFLCTNPLTGGQGGSAPASANLGTLVPDVHAGTGTLVPGKVGARCRSDGFLSIGTPPALAMGPYVLPGNNYHLYDVTLFWANLRADAARRVATWRDRRKSQPVLTGSPGGTQ